MLDKFSYGGHHDGGRGDPFGHLSSSPSQFGHPPISMAAMAAMAAAGMGGKSGSNGHLSHEDSLAFEMLRKTKTFFPQQQVAGRPAFPGQVFIYSKPEIMKRLVTFNINNLPNYHVKK